MFPIIISSLGRVLSIILLGFLILVGFVLGIWQQRSWSPPISVREKLKRSAYVSVSVIFICYPGLLLYNLLQEESKEVITLSIAALVGPLCLVIPFGIIAFIGSIIGFSTQDSILKLGNKISKNKDR